MAFRGYASLCATIIISVCLAGCRVQPLHSTAAPDGQATLSEALASIDIRAPGTRVDQLVINELQFNLSGAPNETGNLPYRLRINTSKRVRSIGIDDIDSGARSFSVSLITQYSLTNTQTKATVGSGSEMATANYERVEQEFANIRSERDAEMRAASAIALRLRQILAIELLQDL